MIRRYIVVAAALAMVASTAEAATLKVDGKNFTTIQAAVDAAQPGDKVLIFKGRYHEKVVVDNKPGLKIVGKKGARLDGGPNPDQVADAPLLDIRNSAGVLVQGLVFMNGEGHVSIDDASDDCRLFRCTSRGADQSHDGTSPGGFVTSDSDGTVVDRCVVRSFLGTAITINGDDAVISKSRGIFGDDGFARITGNRARIERSAGRVIEDGPCLQITGDDAVVSRNDVAFGSSQGIRVTGDNALVERNDVLGRDSAGIQVTGDDAMVLRNDIRAVDGDAVTVTGDRCKIERNKMISISSEGIDVSGDGAEILDNKGQGFDDDGIEVDGTTGLTITGNRIEDCQDHGVSVNIDGAVISDNVIANCGDECIEVSGDDFTVTDNRCSGVFDDDPGISVTTSAANPDKNATCLVEDNVIEECMEQGIEAKMDGGTIRGNVVRFCGGESLNQAGIDVTGDGNTIEDNRVEDCATGGFRVTGVDNTLRGNRALSCEQDGFHLRFTDGGAGDARTTLDDCTATDCSGEGLDNSALLTTVTNCTFRDNRIDVANEGPTGLNRGSFANDITNAGNDFTTGGPDTLPEVPFVERTPQ